MPRSIPKPVPPFLDGYLTKLKSKHTIFGSWATRYFQVNQELDRIEYFKLKQQATDSSYSTGHIDMWDISAVRNFDGNSFQIEAGKRVIFLKADSAAERACWVTGLEEYLDERREYERQVASYDNRPDRKGDGDSSPHSTNHSARSVSRERLRSGSTEMDMYN